MPTQVERLTANSPEAQIKAAISETVAKLMGEGYPQEQALAMAYEQAKKATGKDLGRVS